MIRTKVVELSTIKGIGYKQKLEAGGSGITICTENGEATFKINKRDGSFIPYKIYVEEATKKEITDDVLTEVVSLTRSMPFRMRSSVVYNSNPDQAEIESDKICDSMIGVTRDEMDVINSAAYRGFLAAYSGGNGRYSYSLMNKDMIQFATRSTTVSQYLRDGHSIEQILCFIVRNRAEGVTKNCHVSDGFICELIEILDDMNTRSAFRQLRTWLRRNKPKSKN